MRILAAAAMMGLLSIPALAQPAPPTDEGITLQQQLEQREKMEPAATRPRGRDRESLSKAPKELDTGVNNESRSVGKRP